MPWYTGPTLLACLETLPIKKETHQAFIFPVQWVNRPHAHFRGFSGSIASGEVRVGQMVQVSASKQTAIVTELVTFDGHVESACMGDAITLVLDRELDASRGNILTSVETPLMSSDQFEIVLVWLHEISGLIGRQYDLKLAHQWTSASITSIKHRIDMNSLEPLPCQTLQLNEISVCNIITTKPLTFTTYQQSNTMGGFILVDRFTQATIAVGMIQHDLRRAQNIHRQRLSITRADREKLNGHPGKVIWFTGLSGSGKSTIANELEKALYAKGQHTYILDGDNIRLGLNHDLGFTDAGRVENIRRIAEVAKLMMDAGLIVMTAFISPFRQEREMARSLIGEAHFIEVYVDTPLEVCEQRDTKGLYKKARSGELPHMTGIHSPYEPPECPAIVAHASEASTTEIVEQLLMLLLS